MPPAHRAQIRGNTRTRGLTLLELAIVLAIIGAISAGGMMMLTASVQSSQVNATVARMQAIEAALLNFRVAFTRLPCPGDLTLTSSSANYGFEADAGTGSTNAVGSGTCTGGSSTPAANFAATGNNTAYNPYTVAEGSVPTRALRLPDSYMYDGWGNKFRYAVDAAFTATSAFTTYSPVPGTCAYGGITVKNSTGATRSSVSVYALISHGANGHGAYTSSGGIFNGGSTNADEQTNCSCSGTGAHTGGAGVFTSTFVQKLPATTTVGNGLTVFDDIVDFRERWQMQVPMGDTASACPRAIYIADSDNDVIRKVNAAGIITTFAGNGSWGYSGDGGAATSAELNWPSGVAVDSSSNVYFFDYSNNRLRKVTPSGLITTVAGNGTAGYSGDGGAATSAEMNNMYDMTVDSSGNIYIADKGNNRIRKVTASTGIITTVAGNGTSGYAGDGGAATSAELSVPWGVAVDSSGNIYITDANNDRIRKVTASTGIISTVAGSSATGSYSGDGGLATSANLAWPTGVAVDSSGNIYFSDYNNLRVRKVTASTGIITTVAGNGTAGYSGDGGAATSAELHEPYEVAVDSSGNIYITDYYNDVTRKVTASTGIITTFAGNGTNGYTGDGGPATSAKMSGQRGVAFR